MDLKRQTVRQSVLLCAALLLSALSARVTAQGAAAAGSSTVASLVSDLAAGADFADDAAAELATDDTPVADWEVPDMQQALKEAWSDDTTDDLVQPASAIMDASTGALCSASPCGRVEQHGCSMHRAAHIQGVGQHGRCVHCISTTLWRRSSNTVRGAPVCSATHVHGAQHITFTSR